MRRLNMLIYILPFLLVIRFLVKYAKRADRRKKVVPNKNFEEVEKLGSISKPFKVQATWRDEERQFITREVEVCSLEGHFALESNGWLISHLVVRPPGGGPTELLSYWRLWHLQDPVTGEVAGDMHAFLLGRAGLKPAPYPFIFEQFDVKLPKQPVHLEYINKEDDETRSFDAVLTRIEVRNSGVESFTFIRPKPGSKVPPKPIRLLRSKIKLVALRPDSQESPPVAEPWEWLLRIAREWRPLGQEEPAAAEDKREPQQADANTEVSYL